MIPTYDLMQQLAKLHPESEFSFIMGTDLIPSLHLWEGNMVEDIKYVIIKRKGFSNHEIEKHDNFPKQV